MKRLLTVSGILIALLTLGIVGLLTTSGLKKEITDLTEQGLEACRQSDAAAGLEVLTKTREVLEEKERFLRLYIQKTRLETLEEQLILAQTLLEDGKFGLAAGCFHQMAWRVGEFYKDELPLWENIL